MKLPNLIAGRTNKRVASSPERRPRPLGLERLEDRTTPSTLLLLDYDGSTAAEAERLDTAVESNDGVLNPATRIPFTGMFGFITNYADYRFLDYDNDGRISGADGERAADAILARVRQDFAPYDVDVSRENSTDRAIARVQGSAGEDAIILVSGGLGAGGQAPYDPGNAVDNAGEVSGTLGIARLVEGMNLGDADSRFAFENFLANLISHEVGHSYGLAHIDTTQASPYPMSLMTPTVGGNNLGFTDQTFMTEEGFNQNAHIYLTSTLGASPDPWAAVLRPGYLTIQGGDSWDRVSVYLNSNGDWSVRVQGPNTTDTYKVDPTASPDLNSLNPFGEAIRWINFYGEGGDDFLYIDPGITTSVSAFGDGGNDTLYGGGGRDYLRGGYGHDSLYGQGGDDYLWGHAGDDTISGGSGYDRAYGGPDTDTLQGDNEYRDWS
jgi:Ca2+-binding RTX toxin-like protein